MRIVIINPKNYGRAPEGLRPPFGLLTLASGLMEKEIECQWIDADIIRSNDLIFSKISDYLDYDLLLMGGLSTAYRSIKETIDFIDRSNSKIKILVGGRVAKDTGDILWKFNRRLDMICRQEGEYVIDALLAQWPYYTEVPGIEYRTKDQIIVNPPAPIPSSFEEIPKINWDVLDDQYFRTRGYLLTGRGCPYKCLFCRKKDSPVEKHRSMATSNIIEDVKYMLHIKKLDKITFLDEFFMQDKNRVHEICTAIQNSDLRFEWVCTTRANIISEEDVELLRMMKDSGCTAINMGLESGSQIMLDKMNKKLRIEQSERALAVIRSAGLKIRPTFILGFPGETRETALESVRWRKRQGLKGKFFFATPYPGSDLYDLWVDKNSLNMSQQEAWLMGSSNPDDYSVNLTDMSNFKLRLLGLECSLRLDYKRFFIKKYRAAKRKLATFF